MIGVWRVWNFLPKEYFHVSPQGEFTSSFPAVAAETTFSHLAKAVSAEDR